jgi:hypothetical protein
MSASGAAAERNGADDDDIDGGAAVDEEKQVMCAICCASPKQQTKLGSTIDSPCCAAVFCRGCAIQWVVRRVPSCPTCRRVTLFLFDQDGKPTQRRQLIQYASSAASSAANTNAHWCVNFHIGFNKVIYDLMVEQHPLMYSGATIQGLFGVALHDRNTLSSIMLADLPTLTVWSQLRFFAGDADMLTVDNNDGNTQYVAGGRCYHDRKMRYATFRMDWSAFWGEAYDVIVPQAHRFYIFLIEWAKQREEELSQQDVALYCFLALSTLLARRWPIDFGNPGEIRSHASGLVLPTAKSVSVLQFLLLQSFLCEGIVHGLDRTGTLRDSKNIQLLDLADVYSQFEWLICRHGMSYHFNKPMPALVWYAAAEPDVRTLLVIPPSRKNPHAAVTAANLAEDACSVYTAAVYQGVMVGPMHCVHRAPDTITKDTISLAETLNPQLKTTPDEATVKFVVRVVLVCICIV